MKINQMIRVKRKELALTQEQIAERLGVSAQAVHKWEKGIGYPDITVLPALARLLKYGFKYADVLSGGFERQRDRTVCR